ncbi:MAG: hypothetical protein IT236_07495, partial [Bacteroidia bacterium]|nr:hypothetical protein [Bacteroidia bacterium]
FTGVTRRVGLSLGAYYTSLGQLKFGNKKAEIAKNGFGIQTTEGAAAPAYPGQGLTLVYGQEKEVTSITPTSLHYLVFPAKLQFFISEKQAITCGYSFAYLLDVRSKVETYTENYSTRIYKGSYTTGGYVEGFKTYCSQISVAYRRRLYKNIWVNAELLYGLSDLRDDTFFGINKYERATGINLGLTYNLLKK